ncbi:MAG: hypothetical protein ACXADS_15920 [Candidatus Thorarchaeota archaeon]|jgi:hypothetical protein
MSEKTHIRNELAYIIEKLDPFSKFIDRRLIKRAVGRYRKLITTPEARYPKLNDIIEEFANHDLRLYAQLAEYEPDYAKEAMARLEHLLKWPQFVNENWDDIHPPLDDEGRPMMNEDEYFAFELREGQKKTDPDNPFDTFNVERDKNFERRYKRYVKEWRKRWL